ncbi:nucleotidyl transferase AbiEii/AbiGii toxin family protein [Candidatus Gottesmanbacteria bacterium]|nr:nucleotidyl transferase AbiEii/AbiGii toxin family protein [Candidatus Gottesmanbacteria bacterium]
MSILTKFQVDIIKKLSEITHFKDFFLAGGTALSEFYLSHRYSDDLAFFTEVENRIPQIMSKLPNITKEFNAELEFGRRFETFTECFFIRGKERVRIDFAKDIPFRLKPKIFQKHLGIYIDNVLDISCNKFSALFDRHDAKDFVDIYFIDKEIMPFEKVYENAKKKHIGLDDYWLAVSLHFVEKIQLLPKMIKKLNLQDLKLFYRSKIKNLDLQK